MRAILWAAKVLCLVVVGCSKPLSDSPEMPGQRCSIAHLKSMLRGGKPTLLGTDIEIVGRIVGNDLYGNVYNKIYVEDGSGAVEVAIEGEMLYNTYLYKDEVIVSCSGLMLISLDGMFVLCAGVVNGLPVAIAAERGNLHIKTTDRDDLGDIVPPLRELDGLSVDDIGCFVRLEGVRIEDADPLWVWNDGSQIYKTHFLIDSRGNRLAMPVSRYALFAPYRMALGEGMVAGIVTRFGRDYQMTVCDYGLILLDN